jgi:hypothetical protein
MRGTGKLAHDKTRPGLRPLNTFNGRFLICLSKTKRTIQATSAVRRLFGLALAAFSLSASSRLYFALAHISLVFGLSPPLLTAVTW